LAPPNPRVWRQLRSASDSSAPKFPAVRNQRKGSPANPTTFDAGLLFRQAFADPVAAEKRTTD